MPNPNTNRRTTGRHILTGLTYDTFESYANNIAAAGLSGGVNGAVRWLSVYAGLNLGIGLLVVDTMESYSDGATVDGLNGGNILGTWGGAYRGIAV
jgi:hypothetical protein